MVRPILFNTEMVLAILEGRKTVTRRVVKPQPVHNNGFWELGGAGWSDSIKSITPIPYHSLYNRMPYDPGDILWVRETWAYNRDIWLYKADYPSSEDFSWAKWHPSIHMPRKAARIFLRVTDVRVERLQHLTRDEAISEGCNAAIPILEFKGLWDSTIKPADLDRYGWAANPWVWVIEFERCEKLEEWPC